MAYWTVITAHCCNIFEAVLRYQRDNESKTSFELKLASYYLDRFHVVVFRLLYPVMFLFIIARLAKMSTLQEDSEYVPDGETDWQAFDNQSDLELDESQRMPNIDADGLE